MLGNKSRMERLDRITYRLELADEMTGDLWREIVAGACDRITAMPGRACVLRLNKLADEDAWVDAAFALIDAELPTWKLRRIVYDNGEWHCSLSREHHLRLPEWLDQAVEASHRHLALALIMAAVGAKCEGAASSRPEPAPVPVSDIRRNASVHVL